METGLALDALEQALWVRGEAGSSALTHHSDRGSQYLSIRYTDRLAETGLSPSLGSRGDSYNNALAETVIGLYKTELIHLRGPWKGVDDVELATLEWVHWYNTQRLQERLGYVPPVDYEATFASRRALGSAVEGADSSLHQRPVETAESSCLPPTHGFTAVPTGPAATRLDGWDDLFPGSPDRAVGNNGEDPLRRQWGTQLIWSPENLGSSKFDTTCFTETPRLCAW